MRNIEFERGNNPVDMLEQLASGNHWDFKREGDEISLGITGGWSEYDISLVWMPDHEMLHLASGFDLKIPDNRYIEVMRLLNKINSQLLIGHFDVWAMEGRVVFRQGLLLSGGAEPNQEQLQALLTAGLESCEQYYEAFQYVVWGGQSADLALKASMFATKGNC